MGKRQMNLKRAEVEDAEDRISNLPDVLLTCILSFLSTKDSVRTSVLSTRWKRLWASVPILDLSDCDRLPEGNDLILSNRRKTNFLTFISQFLMQNGPSSIRKIRIRGFECYALSLINLWIYFAKKRNVQELQLEIYFHQDSTHCLPSEDSIKWFFLSFWHLDPLLRYENSSSYTGKLCIGNCNDPSILESWVSVAKQWNVEDLELDVSFHEEMHEFPQSLFTCEMLVVLILEGYMILNFPIASICFPNLKVLHLQEIIYKDNNSASNLINYGCPVLEELHIHRFAEDNLESLIVISHTLKRLEIYFGPEEDVDRELQTLIDAPALQYLDLEDGTTAEYVVENLGALVEAKVYACIMYDLYIETWYAECLFQLLKKICSVKYLLLSDEIMSALEHADSYDLLPFHNLTRLEIRLHDMSGGLSSDWKLMLEFLKSSPNLNYLIFQGNLLTVYEELDLTSEQDVPSCLLSDLKTIEIYGLTGEGDEVEDEVNIVQYFLKNSKVLEKIKITLPCFSPVKEELRETILTLPKGSTACNIEFDVD